MFRTKQLKDPVVLVRGKPYRKRVILADANIPYKLSVDRCTNNLFFCINADEFSDQSFHSAVLNLETEATSIIPGIRNGFASAVDQNTSSVFLGGSDGIYLYNYTINDVMKPALINGIDIFDMYFHKELYFVDTASQNLFILKDGKKNLIPEAKGCLIHHFAIRMPNKSIVTIVVQRSLIAVVCYAEAELKLS
ncbi:ommochrome-binding protein-like [Pectinophora gossypiella]|uniref:ommochrome-binding protein-like n=1 Tax=Pectinophora gossypiella TaxID=13191 RepID=UPI00214E3016|nr:ommochrome-binding protein-like [Pectinophora gossypiella]